MRVVRVRETERITRGERRIRDFLLASDVDGLAFHGFPYWFFDQKTNRRVRREIDFLLVIRHRGILILEVKDGSIHLAISGRQERASWTSTDRDGEVHVIKAPDDQADDAKWTLVRQLHRSGCRGIPVSTGVCLPDTQRLTAGWIAPEIIATSNAFVDAKSFQQFLDGCVKFGLPQDDWPDMDYEGVVEALLPSTANKTGFRAELASTEQQVQSATASVISLVQDQVDALTFLYGHHRAFVLGGAGTGKTVVAGRLAQTLVDGGLRVLLLAPTMYLRKSLRKSLIAPKASRPSSGDDIDDGPKGKLTIEHPGSFTRKMTSKNPKALLGEVPPSIDEDERIPMDNHARILSSLQPIPRYDALIVDEGQDFSSAYVQQILRFVADPANAPIYVFADLQQTRTQWLELEGRLSPWESLISRSATITLGTNCRNSRSIAAELEAFVGPIRLHELSPQGSAVKWFPYKRDISPEALGKLMKKVADDLKAGGIQTSELLVVHAPRSFPQNQLVEFQRNLRSKISNGHLFDIEDVKGLESPATLVVIGPNNAIDQALIKQLYVAYGRARSVLAVCIPEGLQQLLAQWSPISE